MGYEYLSQPQIFLAPITATQGIFGINEAYPLITSFQYWTSSNSSGASVWPIPGNWTMLTDAGSFIVSVGGVVQHPSNYTINRDFRTLTFNFTVSSDVEVGVTQLATAAPSSQNFNFVKTVSGEFDTLSALSITTNSLTAFNTNITNLTTGNILATNLQVTSLTALSSILNVVNITQYEISGFNVLEGNVVINDLLSSSNTFTNNLTASNTSFNNSIAATLSANTLQAFIAVLDNASINTGNASTPLSTDNSTAIATTNFVRTYSGFQHLTAFNTGTNRTVWLSSLGTQYSTFRATVIGGGGGGGGCTNVGGNVGGGGGAGGLALYTFNYAPGIHTITFTVGSGGTGGAAGNNNGTNGGNTTFTYNSYTVTANGGSLGAGSGNTGGSTGGSATNGDLNLTGQNGDLGGAAAWSAGFGGDTPLGFGFGGVGNTNQTITTGISGQGFGSGGAGGRTSVTTSRAGGNGAGGVVIIEY